MKNEDLIKLAIKAKQNAYAPYSNFKVGAALLTKAGKVYLGANVENGCYNPTNCAERSAIFSAISNGEKDFSKLAIVGDEKTIIYPCGPCRQVISELLPEVDIICAKNESEYKVYNIKDLLPFAFSLLK